MHEGAGRIRNVALVGLLDEQYWLCMEDLDWCYRFKQAGWPVLYDGRVSVVNVNGGTSVRELRSGPAHRSLRSTLASASSTTVAGAFHRSMGRFYLRDLAIYLAIAIKLAIAVARSTLARHTAR